MEQENNIKKIDNIFNIEDERILKMEKFFTEMSIAKYSIDNIDFNELKDYCLFNIGINYIKISSLIFQEENKLAELEAKLSDAMVRALDDTKKGSYSRGYDTTSTESKILQDGHPDVIKYTRAVKKQKNYINYLKRKLELIKYYPSNIKILKEIYEAYLQYGSSM